MPDGHEPPRRRGGGTWHAPPHPPWARKGTLLWMKYYKCPCGKHPILLEKITAAKAPRVGKKGKVGANVGWRGRRYMCCANFPRRMKPGVPWCKEFVWVKKGDPAYNTRTPLNLIMIRAKQAQNQWEEAQPWNKYKAKKAQKKKATT